jgi:hypothetical protein
MFRSNLDQIELNVYKNIKANDKQNTKDSGYESKL